MNEQQTYHLTKLLKGFVERQEDLRALAVVGSWARDNPHANFGLELIVFARTSATTAPPTIVAKSQFCIVRR